MYYVYEFYIIETGEIIYAGKGKGKRYKVKWGRNKLLTEMLNKYNCDSRIIKYFDNEKEAFEYEYWYIKELKDKGQCKCNIHCGGAGGSGEYWTDELRHEYSENNVMKDPKQRERMSQQNPMKNPEIAVRVAKQKQRAVIINNQEFESVKEAMEFYHVCYEVIQRWCKKGINPFGHLCRYKDEEQVEFIGKRYNKGGCKPLQYQGKIYESPLDLAEELSCSPSRIYSWLKRGFNPDGITCRYLDDDRDLVYENRYVIRNLKRAKPIIINNIRYSSCLEASKLLNIPKITLYQYLQGKHFNPNYICKYDNQQPSQENFSNSILEGSTTNE